jgi:hypothetical protein
MKVKKIARRLVKKHDLNHCTVEVVRTDGHVILRVTDEKGRGILNRDVGVASDTEQQVQRLTQQYTHQFAQRMAKRLAKRLQKAGVPTTLVCRGGLDTDGLLTFETASSVPAQAREDMVKFAKMAVSKYLDSTAGRAAWEAIRTTHKI